MKNRVFFGIAFRIIILFTIIMMATFLPEELRGFFGDTPHSCVACEDGADLGIIILDTNKKYCPNRNDTVEPDWDWGTRHYWYYWMMVTLFMLSIFNLVLTAINIIKKNYNTSKWML